MENSKTKIPVKGDDLKKINIYSYGMGHLMNDLCASCWFFFLSYYLIKIIHLDAQYTGYIMLAGQVADAIATPLVGIFSDKTETRCGKRTPWYVVGSFLVMVSFVLIFVKVIPDDTSDLWLCIYYGTMASTFNIGWAAVQVAHMALLPSISLNKKNKDLMTRIRTAFTFAAQFAALGLSLLFFWWITNPILQYQVLAISCVALGTLASIIFLVMCREIPLSKNIPEYYETMKISILRVSNQKLQAERLIEEEEKDEKTNEPENNEEEEDEDGPCSGEQDGINVAEKNTKKEIHWTFWLSKPDFYAYIFVYMFVRLSINMAQTVIPFYMDKVLGYHHDELSGTPIEISVVLLILTLGSILNSAYIQQAMESMISKNKKEC